MKKKKFTIEHKQNISKNRKGIKFSEEHRKNLSIAHKGKIPWNKGLKMNPVYYTNFLKSREKLKGIKYPKEMGEKISKALKGKSPWNKGKKYPSPWLIGKKQSIKTIAKRIKKGKEHYNWKGGITSVIEKIRKSIEYRLWREAVFARDNWTCQECKKQGIYLHAHHIKSFTNYPELRFAIDNGITLCRGCHCRKTNMDKQKHS